MSRAYGRFPGERGTHYVTGDAILEVVHTDFADNNRAQYRFYGGDRSGEEFDQTAEHFTPLAKEANCPDCGADVYSIFDHIDRDCTAVEANTRQYVGCKFRIADHRVFSYHNDGPPLAEGDIIRVPDRSSEGWKKVYVVTVGHDEPAYPTKGVIGLHVDEAPPLEPDLLTAR
jgi:hypothetical protein